MPLNEQYWRTVALGQQQANAEDVAHIFGSRAMTQEEITAHNIRQLAAQQNVYRHPTPVDSEQEFADLIAPRNHADQGGARSFFHSVVAVTFLGAVGYLAYVLVVYLAS